MKIKPRAKREYLRRNKLTVWQVACLSHDNAPAPPFDDAPKIVQDRALQLQAAIDSGELPSAQPHDA